MTIRTYIIRRLLLLAPTFLLISLIIFTLIHLAPGDPITIMFASSRKQASPEIIALARKELGLDQPIYIQYLMWLSRLLRGDLGYSYVSGQSTAEMIGVRIGRTAELMLLAEVVSVTLAIVLGVICAVKHYSLVDVVSSFGALMGYSLPSFWIGLMFLLVFSLQLRWLPSFGVQTPGQTFSLLGAWFDHLKHLILPVGVLVIGFIAYLFRMVRSSMLEVLRQDYIVTARAKGLKERVVIYKHALRNALLPVVTYEGYSIGFLLGGAAIVESVFSWPGLGKFAVDLALGRDYPPLMGLNVVIAVMVLLANLCADIAYAIVDPRIRYD
ncbi:MAG: ABC transporter permease [Candidatus Bathyarchaeota archaeon]|nr:ABC transporter permease [Candidatus Bathyarchaeota archaeon]